MSDKKLVIYNMLFKALEYLRNGEVEKAKEKLLEIYEKDSCDLLVSVILYYLLKKFGEYDKAINMLNNIIKEQKKCPFVYYELGELYYDLGKFDEALSFINKSLDIYEKNLDALILSGKIYLDALNQFKKAYNLNPKHHTVLNYLIEINFILGKISEAKKYIKEAKEINPKDPKLYLLSGVIYNKLGEYEKAIKCFDYVIEHHPFIPEAWYGKAVALEKLGKIEDALECYNRFSELIT